MVITVFGATGQVGRRVVDTALSLDYSVRAFGRNVEALIDKDLRNNNFKAIRGHVFDEAEVFDAIKGSDAVLSTLGGGVDETDRTRSLGIKKIIMQMEKANVSRIIALGGLGVLKDDENEFMINRPDYPVRFKNVGLEHLRAFQYLNASNLNWTFVCAPDIIDADANGEYRTNSEYPPTANTNKISTGNLALFMINEILNNHYVKKRVGISDKN